MKRKYHIFRINCRWICHFVVLFTLSLHVPFSCALSADQGLQESASMPLVSIGFVSHYKLYALNDRINDPACDGSEPVSGAKNEERCDSNSYGEGGN